ncbi:MAG: RES family NAD+ phosphorylase [Bryobacterales bacterium]|nr:RES family NAD+ phosphorylase [Bryobacterales bacterium]
MTCCAECFGDRGLRRNIIPLRSTSVGACSYCTSASIATVPPAALTDYFQLLVSAYRVDPEGKLLVQWFRDDWGLFAHDRMDDSRAKDLLAEILDDGDVVRKTFSPVAPHGADNLGKWQQLRNELMYQNRFFPDVNIDLERLDLLLSHLTLDPDEVPNEWYRARIQTGETAYTLDEMGAPPRRTASHGRANPAGIPYLYLGSTPTTAVSEIRPHTGENACVASFRTPPDLKLVDLRWPKNVVSPFLLADAVDISRMRTDLPFLERLGDELTRPVIPQAAAIDYTPSQYLCEFIKKTGYHGVLYRSSVSEGMNMALFNPDLAQGGSVQQFRVDRVSVEVTALLGEKTTS